MAEQERIHFTSPIESRRPYSRSRFEVWSPKLNRRLTLFGELALYLWVILEGTPHIKRYCERPYQTKLFKKDRVIDFWVEAPDKSKFVMLAYSDENMNLQNEIRANISFCTWIADHGISVELFSRQDYLSQKTFVDNWSRIIRFLSANATLINKVLASRVHRAVVVSGTIDLTDLLKSFCEEDPVIIKTAVFSLLHSGAVISNSLQTVDIRESLSLEAE